MKWRQHIRGEIQHQQHINQQDDGGEMSNSEAVDELRSPSSNCYDIPFGMSFIRRWKLFKFVPFCPTFLVDVKHGQTTNNLEANGGRVVGSDDTEMSAVSVQ